ncbi:MAG: HesA/MoeB/ThiF family protein [Bacteroidales bacterium]|jgi:adenylyltransferase/sulfurtransferase|nr:HesA/MoeB/ThiF family protein [Bacteroidales bacterium]
MLSEQDKERFNRQIILPEFGEEAQQRLQQASVMVVGVGGLGSVVGLYLVAAGVGKVGLADNDRVSLSNLQRQILYRENEVGKPKTAMAKQSLAALNSNTKILTFDLMITEANAAEIFSDFDIIIDCTDNFKSRYVINDACVGLGKPFVYGSVSGYCGQVAVFNQDANAATYRCLFPCRRQLQTMTNPNMGVLGVLPAMIASLQVNEAIKFITGNPNGLRNQLLLVNMLTNDFQTISIEPLRHPNDE